MKIRDIPLSKIVDINSKRRKIKIADLWPSIAANGLREPLVVRRHKHGRYRLESGSRRRAALKHLRKEGIAVPNIGEDWHIPCVLEEDDDDGLDTDLSRLIHNVHRELLPSEWGNAFVEIMKKDQKSIVLIASAVGKTVTRVGLLMDVAQAPDGLRQKVDSGELSLSAFARIRNAPPEDQKIVTETEGRVTVRQAQKIVRDAAAERQGPIIPGMEVDEKTTVQRLSETHEFLQVVLHDSMNGPRELYWINEIRELLKGWGYD
jgi:ParB/RepB/Spo0J family partition protein